MTIIGTSRYWTVFLILLQIAQPRRLGSMHRTISTGCSCGPMSRSLPWATTAAARRTGGGSSATVVVGAPLPQRPVHGDLAGDQSESLEEVLAGAVAR